MAVSRVLIARVENTLIALEGSATKQVTALERITPIPRSPRTLLGLISVGGEVMPLIDLGAALELPPEGFSPSYAVVVVHKTERWALALEEVVGFVLSSGEPNRTPSVLPGSLTLHTQGMLEYEGQPVCLLNLNVLENLQLTSV